MEAKSNHAAAAPQHTPNSETVSIPEEPPNCDLTPIQEQIPLPNRPQPSIFPYTYANHPDSVTEGTGLYCSPFHRQNVHRASIDSQGYPLFSDGSGNHNRSATPHTDDQNTLHTAPHAPCFQASLVLPVSDDCKDAATPAAVNETGPVFLETRSICQENNVDHHRTNNGDIFQSVSFAPSHGPFINASHVDQNIGHGLRAQSGNASTDSRVESILGPAPVLADNANVIDGNTNNADGGDKLFHGNKSNQGTEGVAATRHANILCGKMRNADERHNLPLGSNATQGTANTTEITSEVRGTLADGIGGLKVVPNEIKGDGLTAIEAESTKFPDDHHDGEEEEERRKMNSFPGFPNGGRTLSNVIAAAKKALRESDVHSDRPGSAQLIEIPLEITGGNQEPKFEGPETMTIDDGCTKRASTTTSNVCSMANSIQTSPVRKESSAIQFPPLDLLPASAPRLTTANTLAPVNGGGSGHFNQDYYYSLPSGEEQNGTVLSNLPVLQSNMQPPIPCVSPHSYENPTQSPSPFNSATEQPENAYRPRIKSADIPLPFDSNMGRQFPFVDERHGILPGSSSASSMHQPSDVTTFETSLHSQTYCPQCTDPAAHCSAVPMRGRPPAHRNPDIYRTPAPSMQASSAKQRFDKKFPLVTPINPFGVTLSFNRMRHDHLHGAPTTYTGESSTRERNEQLQQIPEPTQRNTYSDESRARVIEHPPISHVNGSKCPYCNKLFKTEKDKQRHVQRMHLMRGRYPCSYAPCKQSFAEAHKLSRHVRTVHLMNRPFKCPHCDSSFGERGNMMQHVRKAHLGHGREAKRARRN